MKKFTDLEFKTHPMGVGIIAREDFANGYGVTVVKTPYTYGGDKGLYELAVWKDGTIHYDSHEHIDSDHIHGHKSYLIGCVHGLAGSGSLVVFAISTMQNTGMLFGFILVFGIGSMIGMTLVSTIMGLPFALSNKTIISKITRYVSGILSFIVGLNIIVQNSTSVNLLGF